MGRIKKREEKSSPLIKPSEYKSYFSNENFTERPCFCFQYLHPKYTSAECSDEQKSLLLHALEKYSTLRWVEIRDSPRHGLGSEKIERNAIKPNIPPSIPKEATFLAFRFAGLAPMVGFRENNIFHIVFIDAHFDVYDH
jgi:hypothetical protein